MTERITPRQFQDAGGTDDWREVGIGACACFRTGSFSKGVQLVEQIGRLADTADHHPDVDLQHATVTVRLVTQDDSGLRLSGSDLELARGISAAARELGIEADPAAVQTVQLTIDATATEAIRPFWRAVLDYVEVGDDDLFDPRGRGPGIWFQPMDVPRTERNRPHIDVFVPNDVAEARVAAALAAGGRVVNDMHAPEWWTLADAEGNEVDVACMYYRE
jgi:4a-hydroxytetrahydrobiopterin dehydratase